MENKELAQLLLQHETNVSFLKQEIRLLTLLGFDEQVNKLRLEMFEKIRIIESIKLSNKTSNQKIEKIKTEWKAGFLALKEVAIQVWQNIQLLKNPNQSQLIRRPEYLKPKNNVDYYLGEYSTKDSNGNNVTIFENDSTGCYQRKVEWVEEDRNQKD